jgi:hypothetical protein
MDRKVFFYAADGSLAVIENGKGHDAADEEWSEAASALMPNSPPVEHPRYSYRAGQSLFLPPKDR